MQWPMRCTQMKGRCHGKNKEEKIIRKMEFRTKKPNQTKTNEKNMEFWSMFKLLTSLIQWHKIDDQQSGRSTSHTRISWNSNQKGNYLDIVWHLFELQYPQPLFSFARFNSIPKCVSLIRLNDFNSIDFVLVFFFFVCRFSICCYTYMFCHVLHHVWLNLLNLLSVIHASLNQIFMKRILLFYFVNCALPVITVYRDNSVCTVRTNRLYGK